MKRWLVQSLFVLVLTGISGFNVMAWLDSHTPLLSHSDEIEQVLELEDESADHSLDSGGPAGGDFESNEETLPAPAAAFFYLDQAHTVLLRCLASIRQLQVNLLNSFQSPPIFILFHTYQGYLS